MARDSAIAETYKDRHQHLAGHLRPDRLRGSYSVAVEAGMILAALLLISRVAATTTVSQVTDDYVEDGRVHILQDKDIPYYATIFRIHGPFLFGATDTIHVVTETIHRLPPVVVLRLRNMTTF